jgi:N-acetylglucosamine-6-phosphate deacetylase
MCAVALAAKGVDRILAITDGTGGAGLPVGTTATLGGRRITVRDVAAFLDDGTLAGSTLTMDRAFRNMVKMVGVSVVDAARLCATNAAQELGLDGVGAIAPGMNADLAVLDSEYRVSSTFVDGREIYSRT